MLNCIDGEDKNTAVKFRRSNSRASKQIYQRCFELKTLARPKSTYGMERRFLARRIPTGLELN